MIKRTVLAVGLSLVALTAAHAQKGGGGGDGGSTNSGSLQNDPSKGPRAGEQSAKDKAIDDEKSQAQTEFDAMDANKDGSVSPDEWMTAMTAQFGTLDANGDGKLTGDEIPPKAKPGAAMAADTNKDGAISRDEFLAQAPKDYKVYDSDWNNKLTVTEMRAKVRADMPAKPK